MGINIIDKILSIEENYKNIAYIYCLIGHFMMVLQWSVIKYLTNNSFDSNQILYIRGVLKYKHKVYPENKGAQKTLYLRFFIQMLSPIFQFYGIQQLFISDATVLSLTNPIWTQLFCWVIYNEKLRQRTLIYTFVSFIGILFICRPTFIFGVQDLNEESNKEKNHLIGCVLMILGSMASAISQSLFKGLQGKTSNIVAMQYYYFSNLISTPALMIHKETNDLRFYTNFYFILILISIAVLGYLAQMFLTRGQMIESPAKLSQLAYTRMLYSYFIDVFFFHSSISLLSLIGFFFILFSSINIILKK